MRSVTYAFLGPEAEAGKFAKKGTASDVTLYNGKKGDAHLNMVTATRYPEKLQSLLIALDLADEIVLQPVQVDRTLGETVVGASLFGKTKGFVRSTDPAVMAQVQGLLKKTPLQGLAPSSEPDGVFREALFERATAESGGPTVIPVDHSFAVKGVGTVILGLVRSGAVAAHATLQAYPSERKLEVRSIQVHDVDVPTAATRCRVGLAVKNIEPDQVPRGTVLAEPGSLKVVAAKTSTSLGVELSPFSKWTPREGTVLHAFHALQDVVVRVEKLAAVTREKANLIVQLEEPLAIVPGQPAVLVDLDQKAQRFVGRALIHDLS